MTTVLRYSPGEAVNLAAEVAALSGQNISACYQCRRCAAGCPVSEATGYSTPDRLIRQILLGKKEAALDNPLLWKCVSCFTCGTRCPNDIMTARVVDSLKKMCGKRYSSSYKEAAFHKSFTNAAKHLGRLNEVDFLSRYALKSTLRGLARLRFWEVVRDHFNQARLGINLLRKGRMHFLPRNVKDKEEFRRLIKKGADRHKGDSES